MTGETNKKRSVVRTSSNAFIEKMIQLSQPLIIDDGSDYLEHNSEKLHTVHKSLKQIMDWWDKNWLFLSLFKCPKCKANRVFDRTLDGKSIHDIHKITVCYNCGWSKVEKVDTHGKWR